MGELLVKRLVENSKLPSRATENSAGYDLYSVEKIDIPRNSLRVISTGLAITVPCGTYGRIAGRSSMALREITTLGGVIDRDYIGEVKIILYNMGDMSYQVNIGDRIAQLILEKIALVNVKEVSELAATDRIGGFGSTGK